MIKWPFLLGNVFLIHSIETANASKAEKASLLRKLRCWWQICYSWSSIYQGFNLQQHIESHLRDNVGFPYSHPYIGPPWLAAITQKRLKKSSTQMFLFHIENRSKLSCFWKEKFKLASLLNEQKILNAIDSNKYVTLQKQWKTQFLRKKTGLLCKHVPIC